MEKLFGSHTEVKLIISHCEKSPSQVKLHIQSITKYRSIGRKMHIKHQK